ncbi:MAG TPA: hypothetical protein VF161_03545 [Steroidobacteraceae bacterium]
MDEHSSRPDPAPSTSPQPLLERVQRELQQELLGKLLHDLRNPIHAIQISLELFGRMARDPTNAKLRERAAAYVDPAEAALASLRMASARLTRYLSVPGAPKVAPLELDELMSEVALLLRASRRHMQVAYEPDGAGASISIEADATRLAHLLIHHCLGNAASSVRFSVEGRPSDGVAINARFDAAPSSAPEAGHRPVALTARELKELVEAAGGKVARNDEAGFSLEFRRAGHH